MTNAPLYTSRQILVGAFIGGPLAGTAMLRSNFLALAEADRARRTLVYGLAGTVAVLAAAFVLPPQVSRGALPAAYGVAFSFVARQFRMDKASLRARRLTIRSNWLVLGVSILFLAITVAVVFGSLLVFFAATGAMSGRG